MLSPSHRSAADMHSDDYFDEDFDSAFLDEVDAIEAAHLTSNTMPLRPSSSSFKGTCEPALQVNAILDKPPRNTEDSVSDYDEYDFPTFDEDELQKLDQDLMAAPPARVIRPQILQPVASTSHVRQTTLDGRILPPSPPKPPPRTFERTKSAPRSKFGQKLLKTKTWDYSLPPRAKQHKAAAEAKEKAKLANGEVAGAFGDDEEPVEFEQFPQPSDALAALPISIPPMRLKASPDICRDWIFPTNKPRRDYQYNIAQHCLYENTLVSLPTGLGKTFIAGVVMLNYYRWFQEGKVVFVAPTKPLVAQQIEACIEVCGIDGADAVELTGENNAAMRSAEWLEKRVFFMTPQTFMNDLVVGRCDPLDIILLVVDEAHKATGDHAYAQMVRILMAKNPHFRVLALTATPGSNPTAVQQIITSLHISHIEIRNEESIDLKPYLFNKEVKLHEIEMSDDILRLQAVLVKTMEPLMQGVRDNGLLQCHDARTLHAFACKKAMDAIKARPDAKQLQSYYGPLAKLSALARIMAHLTEFSISSCCKKLKELAAKVEAQRKRFGNQKSALNMAPLMHEVESQMIKGVAQHPKAERLLSIAMEHFVPQDAPAAGAADAGEQTRMMVFVSLRSCVDELVALLNVHQPLIRASRFVGQGTDNEGNKGVNQSQQLEILRKFKAGFYNVLVATCIGEEGLDIGEVDRIVCYDASKTPIRTLQRVGRTGRKRTGYVDVLLAKGREERNWQTSNESYEEVQRSIALGRGLELYGDVERLIPDNVHPAPLEMHMPIKPIVKKTKAPRVAAAKNAKGQKRKRNDDVSRNIPLGAASGFVSVSELIVKGAKAKRTRPLKPIGNRILEDDDDDRAIEAGLSGIVSSTAVTEPVVPIKKARKPAVRKPRAKKKTQVDDLKELTHSQLSKRAMDDSDDMEIEMGLLSALGPKRTQSPAQMELDIDDLDDAPAGARSPVDMSIIDIASSSPEKPKPDTDFLASPGSSILGGLHSSPECSPSKGLEPSPFGSQPLSNNPPSLPTSDIGGKKEDWSWLTDDEDNDTQETFASEGKVESITGSAPSPEVIRTPSPPNDEVIPASENEDNEDEEIEMPPPPVPSRSASDSHHTSSSQPSSSFPIRKPLIRKRPIPQVLDSSSPFRMPPPSQPCLKGRSDPRSSPCPPKRHKKDPVSAKDNVLFDFEAEHSGEEVSEGESECEAEESESDREFVRELPETQMPRSYNQAAAYRYGLMTQAPTTANAPVFATRPLKRGRVIDIAKFRQQAVLHSPPHRGSDPDEYDMDDSFVVQDDEPLIYTDRESDL